MDRAASIEESSCFPPAISLSMSNSGLLNEQSGLAVFIMFHKVERLFEHFNRMEPEQCKHAVSLHHQVSKRRQEPYDLSCVRREFQKTIRSVLFEAYVLNKARELTLEFNYRDFLELKHDSFRRIVLRLRRKGKVVPNTQRTVPQFYFLAERITEYSHNQGTTQ